MKPRLRRLAAHGRTKGQHLALVAAQQGKLFKQDKPHELVFRNLTGRLQPVRTFTMRNVGECVKAGWLALHDQGDGRLFRVMTTPAGDHELLRPLRLVKPRGDGLHADWRQEALR